MIIKKNRGPGSEWHAPILIGEQIEIVVVALHNVKAGVEHDPQERRRQLAKSAADPFSQAVSSHFIAQAKPPFYCWKTEQSIKRKKLARTDKNPVKKRGRQGNVDPLSFLQLSVGPFPFLNDGTLVFKNQMGKMVYG